MCTRAFCVFQLFASLLVSCSVTHLPVSDFTTRHLVKSAESAFGRLFQGPAWPLMRGCGPTRNKDHFNCMLLSSCFAPRSPKLNSGEQLVLLASLRILRTLPSVSVGVSSSRSFRPVPSHPPMHLQLTWLNFKDHSVKKNTLH